MDGAVSPSRGALWQVAIATFALTLYPPLYALWRSGVEAGFGYVNGDALLYLTIARNSHFGWFSYDGTTVTNGFHPLWQWILTFLFSGNSVDQAGSEVVQTTVVSALCTALGIAMASVTIFKLTRSRLLSMLTLPSVHYLLLGAIVDNHTTWDDVSGMESGLSVLVGGALLLVCALHVQHERTLDELVAQRGIRSVYLQMGLILPFLVLARLDDVFIVGTLGLTPLLASVPWAERVRASLRVGMPTALVLVAYVVYNMSSAGTPLPISGMTKSGFVLPASSYVIVSGFFPPLIDLKNAFSGKQSAHIDIFMNAFRGVQLLFPALLVVVSLYFSRDRGLRSGRYALLAAIGGHVVIKAGYNLMNVHLWHQGGWYFALNILIASVLVAIALEGPYHAVVTSPRDRVLCAMLLAAPMFLASGRHALVHAYAVPKEEIDFWSGRETTVRELEKHVSQPKLIAFDDGLSAYALPLPTIHGFGFAADLKTFRALQARKLLAHAYERGHRVLTSGTYMAMPTPVEGNEALLAFLQASFLEENVKAELVAFDYRLLYVEPTTHAPFIEFAPRGQLPAR